MYQRKLLSILASMTVLLCMLHIAPSVASAQSAEVDVNVSCQRNGQVIFNGTIWNAPPNRHYPSYYMYTKWSDGSVGGYFDWIPMGMVQTGGGVGSTNTVYLPASNLNEVEVRIRIGFTDGVSRVSCR